MPYLSLTTNQTLSSEQSGVLRPELSGATAQVLGKSEQYVMVEINTCPDMLFAGTDEPLALMRLCSIGLPPDRTTEISATLTSCVNAVLGIEPDRVYIEFCAIERHMWGWNGRTFGGK